MDECPDHYLPIIFAAVRDSTEPGTWVDVARYRGVEHLLSILRKIRWAEPSGFEVRIMDGTVSTRYVGDPCPPGTPLGPEVSNPAPPGRHFKVLRALGNPDLWSYCSDPTGLAEAYALTHPDGEWEGLGWPRMRVRLRNS